MLGFILIATPSRAEIEKVAVPCEETLCFFWWPKLPAILGWHHDRNQSFNLHANAQVPDGSTFANAEVVIYARAIYKPRQPGIASVQALMEGDRTSFLENIPDIQIDESSSVTTADGTRLRSVTFFPASKGNWERVSYGEEGDFYLLFAISARNKRAYERESPVYERFISGYRLGE